MNHGDAYWLPSSARLLLESAGDARDDIGCSVILRAAYHHDPFYPNLSVLDVLLGRDYITREDKIDALEVAGALLLKNENRSEEEVALAFRYWRRALTLRLIDTEDDRPIYKTPLKTMNGSLNEWSTEEDLVQIELDPSQHEIQSLLVRLRIFSGLCWRAVFERVYPSIQMLLTKGLNGERPISQVLDVSWIILDTLLRTERPHENSLHSVLIGIVGGLIATLKDLRHLRHLRPKDDPNLNSEIFKKLVDVVYMADPSYFSSEAPVDPNHHLIRLYIMVSTLSRHPDKLTDEVRLRLVQLVHRDSRSPSGYNLLHIACCRLDSDTLHTIRFLVQLGANLNARIDITGCGVLHILIKEPTGEMRDSTARLLLDLGAHLDMADNLGRTAADFWLEKNNQDRHHLPDWLKEGVPMLQCLSARVIRRNRVPYKDNNVLPAMLVPFVSLH